MVEQNKVKHSRKLKLRPKRHWFYFCDLTGLKRSARFLSQAQWSKTKAIADNILNLAFLSKFLRPNEYLSTIKLCGSYFIHDTTTELFRSSLFCAPPFWFLALDWICQRNNTYYPSLLTQRSFRNLRKSHQTKNLQRFQPYAVNTTSK